MQAADLVKYINDPQLLDKQSIAALQKLAEDFPYFQLAHMLLSMASRKWDASIYQQSLKRTAIVVTNREHLFNLVQAIEHAEIPVVAQQPVVEAAVKEEAPVAKEEPVQSVIEETPAPVTETPVIETPAEKIPAEQPFLALQPEVSAEQVLEKEIEKNVVNAFVEKELLKTPELHHPKPKAEPENFTDWLALLKKNNGQPGQTTEAPVKEEQPAARKPEQQVAPQVQAKKQKHRALIDKIIESSPGLIRTKEEQKFFVPDMKAKESLLENEHLVTETLANIYALQGSVNKAVRAYEILSLKFPQKSAYFATLIQKLKNNQ